MKKKLTAAALVTALSISAFSGLAYNAPTPANAMPTDSASQTISTEVPKYVFLFIGDGVSYPQIQSTSYYLGAMASNGGVETQKLSFMDFEIAGSAQTYDSTSFAPDSASTATSIATGEKTYSGVINMDTTYTQKFETIAEKLKAQKDYKVGVVTSVNLNHATPAAFYAHQETRNNYYEIGVEMVESGFDYFAGGALKSPTGTNKDQTHLHELATAAGYKIAETKKAAERITAADEKVIIIDENLADGDAFSYDMDLKDGQWDLANYVAKGIEVLDNETGFFMMVEGGKVDWAGHANDATAIIKDTIAFSDAVEEAVKFYNEHPEDTLIIVTGDHETGGMTIGFAGTDYDTYLTNLSNQKLSYAKFDTDFVAGYKENNTSFTTVLSDIQANFGLVHPDFATSTTESTLILTEYEIARLSEAYNRTLTVGSTKKANMTQEDYVLYGTYEPLTVTITHILNNKSGIAFTSYAHTGLPVPVFAQGNGSSLFEGYYDNTDIYSNLAKLTGVN